MKFPLAAVFVRQRTITAHRPPAAGASRNRDTASHRRSWARFATAPTNLSVIHPGEFAEVGLHVSLHRQLQLVVRVISLPHNCGRGMFGSHVMIPNFIANCQRRACLSQLVFLPIFQRINAHIAPLESPLTIFIFLLLGTDCFGDF